MSRNAQKRTVLLCYIRFKRDARCALMHNCFLYNGNRTKWSPIWSVIVSITKFSIVIGSPHAYLSRNWCAIRWVSNYRSLISTFSNRTPVIGYPRDFHVNYARFNGFLSNVFYSFQDLRKALRKFSLKRSSQKTFLIPKFVIDTINQ